MKISKHQKSLIRAFIKFEASQFGRENNKTYIQEYFDLLLSKIRQLKNLNYLTIKSLSNMGFPVAQLNLDFYTGKKPMKNYFITLCTCGKLNHTCFVSEQDEILPDLTSLQ